MCETDHLCDVCLDASRDTSVICAVEDAKAVMAMEKIRDFNGVYHVLGGTISPMDGIGPEQIRIKELLEDGVDIPEERILVEAAVFADKSNITEELVRLDSHMKQLADILTKSKEPVGKKLDFLVQEMNREANTIGSKANDLEITSLMLETKSEIEKIREQVQNIE